MLWKRPQGHNRVVIRAELSAAKWLNIHYPERNRNFRDCLRVDNWWRLLVPTSISTTDTQKLKKQNIYSDALKKKSKQWVSLVSNSKEQRSDLERFSVVSYLSCKELRAYPQKSEFPVGKNLASAALTKTEEGIVCTQKSRIDPILWLFSFCLPPPLVFGTLYFPVK